MIKISNEDNQYNFENLSQQEKENLFESMLENIGTTDGYLRDNIYLMRLVEMLESEPFTNEKLIAYTEICLEQIKYGLGEINSDSVFKRSFSALVLYYLAVINQQRNFLSNDLKQQIMQESIYLFKNEQDIRGYVKGKGWAHSIAHYSDLIAGLVTSDFYDSKYNEEILDVLNINLQKLNVDKSCYIDDEEERMLFIVFAMLDKQRISEEAYINWLNDSNKLMLNQTSKNLEGFRIRTNYKHFYQSMYFRAKGMGKYKKLVKQLEIMINDLFVEMFVK